MLVLLVGGCSSSTESECTGSLQQVAGNSCPETYDAALEAGPACPGAYGSSISLGRTGDSAGDITLFVRSRNNGAGTSQCFYDLQTRALVGAIFCNDIPVCENSHAIHYGRTTRDCFPPRIVESELSCSSMDAGL